jgi:hypothetical protein
LHLDADIKSKSVRGAKRATAKTGYHKPFGPDGTRFALTYRETPVALFTGE